MVDLKSKNRKPPPLLPIEVRSNCSICGERTYSHTGVHPQCAYRLYAGFRKKKA